MASPSTVISLGYGSWGSVNDVITLGYGIALELPADFVLVVHASATSMLLHAEETAGQKNTLYILTELTDETGELLVDQAGEVLTAFGETAVIVLHARPTSTLIHAEET